MTNLLDEIKKTVAHPIISGNWVIRPSDEGYVDVISTSYGPQRVMVHVFKAPVDVAPVIVSAVTLLKDAHKEVQRCRSMLERVRDVVDSLTDPNWPDIARKKHDATQAMFKKCLSRKS